MGKLAATLRSLGPGLLVTAAFIGPGTIVTSSRAGARYGFALLWAVVFSVIATAVLQEMAARLGIVRRSGLSDAIRQSFRRPLLRYAALGLVALAITVGNAAYEAGNLLGASLGLELTLGWTPRAWVVVIAVAATVLLGSGTYRVIQSVLVALVVVMSAVFLFTAVMVGPAPGELLKGMLVPQIPAGSLVTISALIGTTVVPYNLFLHASAVQEKWSSEVPADEALPAARLDTYLSVTLGGAVTLAIIVTATPLLGRGIEQADALMVTGVLEPILGSAAKTFFGLGLFRRRPHQRDHSTSGSGLCDDGRARHGPRHEVHRLSQRMDPGHRRRCRLVALGRQPHRSHPPRAGCEWASAAAHRHLPARRHERPVTARALSEQMVLPTCSRARWCSSSLGWERSSCCACPASFEWCFRNQVLVAAA